MKNTLFIRISSRLRSRPLFNCVLWAVICFIGLGCADSATEPVGSKWDVSNIGVSRYYTAERSFGTASSPKLVVSVEAIPYNVRWDLYLGGSIVYFQGYGTQYGLYVEASSIRVWGDNNPWTQAYVHVNYTNPETGDEGSTGGQWGPGYWGPPPPAPVLDVAAYDSEGCGAYEEFDQYPPNDSPPVGGDSTCWRLASQTERTSIVKATRASGEWRYTQGGAKGGVEPAKNIPMRNGDCTDYVWQGTRTGLGTSWQHSWSQRPGTRNFREFSERALLRRGYKEITQAQADSGDVVVRDGHAGIYIKTLSDGRVQGIANNGSPAYPDSPNQDGATGIYYFTGEPRFYRAVVTIPCQ